ncbi:hypothetical protein LZG74_11400 [Dyadobacter sp. CY327]|uniref:hypothetical protein n=1 Tax=Dyadobacter sp. CY327 TaxID=2907301 RepID=UPI001F261920|nr:hypothetical protein [Dyadobacter sp. CY327]MCE7070913.1 hypothetical protein [Dyadobacter sp. CY327]
MTRLNFKYSITGIFQGTKRKRTVIEIGPNPEFCCEKLKAIGYIEPFEVSEPLFEPPSEAQLNYARKLEIKIPEHASAYDMSALLSRKEDEDRSPSPAMLDYAFEEGLYFSKYIGQKSLYNVIFHQLPLHQKAYFFAFCVYAFHANDRNSNPGNHSKKPYFEEFASQQITNESFVRSLNKHSGSELIVFGEFRESDGVSVLGASKNTIAYQNALKFLKEKGLVRTSPILEKKIISNPATPKTAMRVTQITSPKPARPKQNNQHQPTGCIIIGALILTIIFWIILF